MNQTTDLSPKQFEALKAAFTKKHGISVLGLSREMKCDTAMAKNLIRQLLDIDFLADYKNGNHGVTREGRDYLIKMKLPGADRKPIGRPREESDYVDPYDMPPKKEPNKVVVDSTPAAADKFKESFLAGGVEDQKIHTEFTAPDWAAKSEACEFSALVHKGLARLNERLGFKPVKIQNLDLKIETLTKLAGSVSPASIEVAQLLTEIAQDLKNAGGVK